MNFKLDPHGARSWNISFINSQVILSCATLFIVFQKLFDSQSCYATAFFFFLSASTSRCPLMASLIISRASSTAEGGRVRSFFLIFPYATVLFALLLDDVISRVDAAELASPLIALMFCQSSSSYPLPPLRS